jgi:hypothetical protein
MMKKLLVVFALVFAITSAANAALTLKIVDDGIANPLNIGKFGLQSLTNYTGLADDTFFCIVSATPPPPYPTVGGGGVMPGAPASTQINGSDTPMGDAVANGIPLPAGENGVWGYVGDAMGVPVAAGTYIDGLQGTAGQTLMLYLVNADWTLGAKVDTVTLVPEPMTLVMLGLGGLFLRRRK